MSAGYEALPPWAQEQRLIVNVIVDTPRGSRCKYKLDDATGQFKLSHILALGMQFPYDFGSIPGTRADDADPLDVMYIGDAPTFSGCIVEARLIGVLEAEQSGSGGMIRNDRLLAVAAADTIRERWTRIEDIGSSTIDQIQLFFENYNRARDRQFKVLQRRGADAAAELVHRAIGQCRNQQAARGS
jgi:inorganic pyrophosphatase